MMFKNQFQQRVNTLYQQTRPTNDTLTQTLQDFFRDLAEMLTSQEKARVQDFAMHILSMVESDGNLDKATAEQMDELGLWVKLAIALYIGSEERATYYRTLLNQPHDYIVAVFLSAEIDAISQAVDATGATANSPVMQDRKTAHSTSRTAFLADRARIQRAMQTGDYVDYNCIRRWLKVYLQ